MRSQKGFSLIETAIGLAILGITGITLLYCIAVGAKSVLIDNTLSKAGSLSHSQLEYVQSQPYNPANTYLTHDIPANCSDLQYGAPMVTSIETGLQKVTVTVTHGTTTYSIVGYKVNR
jgi:prepilin-type N-terminal cleavage/methylation domain-containing protein